jgi:hydrogenase-4 component F
MSAIGGGMALLPWSGPLFLLSILALSAVPPFGIFRSEFEIVAGGLASGSYAAAAALVVLVTVAFFGLATSAGSMLLTSGSGQPPAAPRRVGAKPRGEGTSVALHERTRATQVLTRGEPSVWMVVPVLAGLAVLVLLGVHPPGELTALITRGAAELGGRP